MSIDKKILPFVVDATTSKSHRKSGAWPTWLKVMRRGSPGKNTTGRRFLWAQRDTLIVADFFTTEVLSWNAWVPIG